MSQSRELDAIDGGSEQVRKEASKRVQIPDPEWIPDQVGNEEAAESLNPTSQVLTAEFAYPLPPATVRSILLTILHSRPTSRDGCPE